MPKDKVSEWSSTPSNNTDIGGINIAEGCAPSGINNAIRELMAQVKDMQTGADNDGLVVGGTFTSSGGAVFTSTITANWWQLRLWRQRQDPAPLQRLERLRRQLRAYVQPRLAWEVALLELCGALSG